jgi:phage protein|nr:MAG TPA: Nucleotide modification associated domain 1 [Caudoviricetes sp.]
MTKVNNNTMREQYDGQYKTFCKKNSDYGNSFEESLDKHGIVASIVRMGDKMNRLESLTDDSRTQQVGSESLLDTLEDLSNYAAMTACWLKGVRAKDGEEETICIMSDDAQINAFAAAIKTGANILKDQLISKKLDDVLPFMVKDLKRQRDPKLSLNHRHRIVEQRRYYYKHIAACIIDTDGLEFNDFTRYIKEHFDLTDGERQLLCEGVMEEIYSQTDKNPGGEEEPEFRTKKFNIPKEE